MGLNAQDGSEDFHQGGEDRHVDDRHSKQRKSVEAAVYLLIVVTARHSDDSYT